MTLKFIQTIKNEINVTLPDNNTGLITPAVLRNLLQDMTDSLYNRFAAIFGDHVLAPVAQPITAIPTNYPGLYNANVALDPAVLSVNQVLGEITINVTGFITEGSIGFTANGANGRVLTANLAKNGTVNDRFKTSASLTGAGNNESAQNALPLIAVIAGDKFTLLLSGDIGFTPNISQVILQFQVKPTFSAV